MTLKSALKKDYFLLPLLSVLYFLTIKDSFSATIYLIIAFLISIYFFPVKLFMRSAPKKSSAKINIFAPISYFVISNIIILTILTTFNIESEFLSMTILIYSVFNIALLIYFHFTESGGYNFILTCCALLLTPMPGIIY